MVRRKIYVVINLGILLLGLYFNKEAASAQTVFVNTTATINYTINDNVSVLNRSNLTMLSGGNINGQLDLGDNYSTFTMQDGNVGSIKLDSESFNNVSIYGGVVGDISVGGLGGNLSIYGGTTGLIGISNNDSLNISGGIITGVSSNSGFTMTGGHITGSVSIGGGSSEITNGTIDGTVTSLNSLSISSGVFKGKVTFYSGGTISGGMFDSIQGSLNVSGGQFRTIINTGALNISNGTLAGELNNVGTHTTITGGNISGNYYNFAHGVLDVYGQGLALSADGHLTGKFMDGGTIDIVSAFPLDNGTINLYNLPRNGVSGTINFKGLVAQAAAQNVTFTFRPNDGSPDVVKTLSVPPVGTFTLSDISLKAGVLHIKSNMYLAVNVPVDLSAGNVTGLKVTLQPGDSNNDNNVDSTDFGVLIGAYGSDAGISGSGYDPTADFNGDGSVDSTDFGILIGNFNTAGAP